MNQLRHLTWLVNHKIKNVFAEAHESPIIVLGNQKSGTSVIAHLLADWGGLSKTVDIPQLWGKEGVQIIQAERSFSNFVEKNRSYFSAAVIKEPMMTFFADQVVARFPNGQYVFIVRDPRDNIRSLLNRRQLPGDLAHLQPEHMKRLGNGRVTVDASVWGGAGENYIGVLAHRWNKAVDAFLEFQDRMLLVHYEEFVLDKYAFIENLATQLKIARTADISSKLNVQYQPKGNRNADWHEFYGASNLECIERICLSRMRKVGYDSCL